MTRDEAIETLKTVAKCTIPGMFNNWQLKDSFEDEKSLISRLFNTTELPIIKACVALLESDPNDEIGAAAIQNYKEAVRAALDHIQRIRENNIRLIPKSIPADILAVVKVDDAEGLKSLLTRCERDREILSHYAYALRVAANGAINCLRYLITTRCADPTTPGATSGKIAMHWAIDGGHADCVHALLWATNSVDYYDPAGQLLYGTAPNRPIDRLSQLDNQEAKAAIITHIHDALDGAPGDGMLMTPEKMTEIRGLLSAIRIDGPAVAASASM